VWLAGAWLLVIVLARYTTLDQALTAGFHDPETAGFPLRHSAFWSTVMHSGLKYLSIAIWLTLLVSWLLLARWLRNKHLRGVIGFTLLVAPLSALVVSVLRSLSAHSCPWELAVYGGGAEYFRFFDSVPADPGTGRCVPSGHASAGFMWIAGYVAARRASPVAARLALALTLCLGVLTGLTQIVRGAHFLSHVLLTAWVCYAVAWVSDLGWRYFSRRR
jgi:membrane-associated PAP2 superfamily phosphatase